MQFTFKLLAAALLAEQGVNAIELSAQEKSSPVHGSGPYSVPEAYRVYASPSPHLQGYGHGYGGYGGHSYGGHGYGYGNAGYVNTYGYGPSNAHVDYRAPRSYGHGSNYGSSYSTPSTGGYSHCDADCEAKVGEVKAAMAGKLQDTADTCVENAEALREEILGEIRALRERLSQEAQDRAQASVNKLSDQVDMDLALLLDTFNTLKGEIDEEKHNIAEKIEKLAWETKSKISKLKGYSGRSVGSYGGYNRYAHSGYSQPSYGYSKPSSYGHGHTDVDHAGYGPSTSQYGFGNHGGHAVPAKGYLGYGDRAYSTGPIEKKNEGPHPGLYGALLFAQIEEEGTEGFLGGDILGGPQTFECADGTKFECNAGVQGCFANSPDFCKNKAHSKHDDSGAHADVHALVEAFSDALEAKAAGFEQFIAERRDTLASQVAEKKANFDALAADELAGWNVDTAAAEKEMAWQKAGKIHGFEQFFNKKLWAMDQSIKELEWYFSDIFTKTLRQIDGEVDSYEISALLKKANSKKHAFLKDIWAIRQGLKEAGIAIRDGLRQDLDDEWQAMLDSIEESRNFLTSESARLAQALADGSAAITDDLDMSSNHVSDWLDQRISWAEHEMEKFLHGFNGYYNHYSYQPRGYYQRGHGCPRIGNYDAVIRGCGFGGGYGHGYSKGYSGYGSGYGYGPSPAKAKALVGALIDFKNDH